MNAFFGFIPQEYSAMMTKSENNEEGMYILRLAPLDSPTAVSIDYVQYGALKTIDLLYHPADGTWEVSGAGSKFASVSAAISGIGASLRRAYYRQFPKLQCFYFDSTLTSRLLKAAGPDDFLIRFSSSTANAITACMNTKEGKITQIQIALQPLGKYLPSGGKEYDTLDAMLKSTWFKARNPINKKTRALPSSLAQQVSTGPAVKPSTDGYNVHIEPANTPSGLSRAQSGRGVLNTVPTRAPSGLGPNFSTEAHGGRNRAATSDDLREAMDRYTKSDVEYTDVSRLDASSDGFPVQDVDSFPVVASPRGGDEDSFPVMSNDSFPVVGSSNTSNPHLRQTVSSGTLSATTAPPVQIHRTTSMHQPVAAGARPVTGFPAYVSRRFYRIYRD